MFNYKETFRKIIAQYRFRPTLVSYAKISDFASEFEEHFEEWQSSKPSNVTLFSPKVKLLMTLADDSISYVDENLGTKEEDTDKHITLLKEVFTHYMKEFSVSTTYRIGFRIVEVLQTDLASKDLADIIHKKLFAREVTEKLSIEPEDIAFIFDGKRNSIHHKIRISPLRKEEVQQKMEPAFGFDFGKLNDGCLLIDIDVYYGANEFVQSEAQEKLAPLKRECHELREIFFLLLTND